MDLAVWRHVKQVLLSLLRGALKGTVLLGDELCDLVLAFLSQVSQKALASLSPSSTSPSSSSSSSSSRQRGPFPAAAMEGVWEVPGGAAADREGERMRRVAGEAVLLKRQLLGMVDSCL